MPGCRTPKKGGDGGAELSAQALRPQAIVPKTLSVRRIPRLCARTMKFEGDIPYDGEYAL